MSRERAAAAAAVLTATCAVFWPLVSAGFVNWDDPYVLLENPRLRGFSLENLRWMATTFHMTTYQPVSWLAYAAVHALSGLSPAGFHAAGVLLHGGSAALLCLLAARLGAPPAWAALAALLWAVHPLQVQAAGWASALNDALSLFVALLATHAYLSWAARRSRASYAAALALFTLAGLARWKALCLPALWLLLDAGPLRRLGRGAALEKVPFALVAAALAAATAAAKGLSPADGAGWAAPPEAAAKTLFYWRRLAWPEGVAPIYSREFVWLGGDFERSAPWLLLAATAGAAWLARRTRGPLLVWLGYLSAIAPTTFFSQTGPALAADHYAYLAFTPLALGVGLWGARASRRSAAAALGLAVLLAARCSPRLAAWHDSVSLWVATLESDPRSPVARTALASALIDAGRLEPAAALVREQVRLFPEDSVAKAMARRLLPREGRLRGPAFALSEQARREYEAGSFAAAEALVRRARRLEPRAPELELSLGLALYRQAKYPAARAAFERAVALDPEDPEARNALGTVLVRLGRVSQARAEFAEAARLSPGSERYRDNVRKADALLRAQP